MVRRLQAAMSVATAGELHRAADFLEFARDVRRGKRQQRSGWRGRRSNAGREQRYAESAKRSGYE
jgi:hypothetical protein